jgi:hypothetical protein
VVGCRQGRDLVSHTVHAWGFSYINYFKGQIHLAYLKVLITLRLSKQRCMG